MVQVKLGLRHNRYPQRYHLTDMTEICFCESGEISLCFDRVWRVRQVVTGNDGPGAYVRQLGCIVVWAVGSTSPKSNYDHLRARGVLPTVGILTVRNDAANSTLCQKLRC